MDASALYLEACARGDARSGYYNRNVKVESGDGPVMVRIPATGSESMDLTMWPEHAVLDAIQPYVTAAPQLLHAQSDPAFQIHEFIAGTSVDEMSPAGTRLPLEVLEDIGTLFAQMLRVPNSALPEPPPEWPKDGDTNGFVALLLRLVRTIRRDVDDATKRLYQELSVPEDPCAFIEEKARAMPSRPFRLLHADIHRKNMIRELHGTVFLDWELALWGDPVYDLADHLHKMAYLRDEREQMISAWVRAAPAECREGWEDALAFYTAYERMKSAVVDTVRWSRLITSAPTPELRRAFACELADKFAAARQFWEPHHTVSSPAEIESATARWADRCGGRE